jgi:hypothetical protein
LGPKFRPWKCLRAKDFDPPKIRGGEAKWKA